MMTCAAAGDMGKIMGDIIPVFYEVQGHAMIPYGFEPTDEGVRAAPSSFFSPLVP